MSTTRTEPTADDVAERLVGAYLGWVEMGAVHIGDRLGWYASLASDGPATADELAARTRTSSRYAREWLEQQATSGILRTDPGQDANRRRYTLPPGAAEALTDVRSLAYAAPLARLAAASGKQMSSLVDAFRSGGGVSWQQFGVDAREAQADMNRPWFDRMPDALSRIDRLQTLLSRPDARAADVGSGAGWSSIALARAFPQLRVDGFDLDEPSVMMARANAEAASVDDRVRFHVADVGSLEREATFDAVFAFECLHDMARPVEVLRAMRRAKKGDGAVIVMDEAVADRFGEPDAPVDGLMYGFSLFVCLPDAMSHRPTAATGTVMRPDTLRGYAREAGFADIETLPVGDFGFFRFYEAIDTVS